MSKPEFESAEAFYKRVTAISSCWAAIHAIVKRDDEYARASAAAKISDAWLRETWLAGYQAAQNDCSPFRDPDEPYEACPYPAPPAGETKGGGR